ncbi:hypothetical protein [Mongoliibacter ruber]|uniref:Uncharacterized protein n=1 Tax=Mongoliibacter ruber TaxID=1750599 RepID=A0A2T0WPM6_9BACT|nr:hypothetical protein [Mongoliibacter ruber]PRY88637.1 hypothetical protein CLW00_104289 [Mongoliibacter ruber]
MKSNSMIAFLRTMISICEIPSDHKKSIRNQVKTQVLTLCFSVIFGLLSAQTVQTFNTQNGITSIFPNQTIKNVAPNTQNVYSHNNYGIQEIFPSQVIKTNPQNGVKQVFNTNNGIPEITPAQVIKPNHYGGFDVFETSNGIPDISPSKTIKSDPFGTLMVHPTQNGIQSLAPSQAIVPTSNGFDIVQYKSGLPELFPSKSIKIKD